MKHIFIINPAAGKGKSEKVLLPRIIETSKRLGIDYAIHRTLAPGDAGRFVSRSCAENESGLNADHMPDKLRFYSCGGDGTLNEVVNGAYGHQNVEIAMIPAGTGNDFPRNFRHPKAFEEIEGQIFGQARPIDIIRYQQTGTDNQPASAAGYGVNMFNIGLDCNVVDLAADLKTHPFVPGLLAYGLGVCIVLGKKEGVNLEIRFDDGEIHKGDFMLAAIGNGAYCGGGFKGVPGASLDDGLIDVSIVREISRHTFLSLLSKYRKGTHLEAPSTAGFVTYRQCRGLTVTPQPAVKLCTDGEISMTGQTTFEIVPGGINFSVPRACESI